MDTGAAIVVGVAVGLGFVTVGYLHRLSKQIAALHAEATTLRMELRSVTLSPMPENPDAPWDPYLLRVTKELNEVIWRLDVLIGRDRKP